MIKVIDLDNHPFAKARMKPDPNVLRECREKAPAATDALMSTADASGRVERAAFYRLLIQAGIMRTEPIHQ
jgi:hypothetical protein